MPADQPLWLTFIVAFIFMNVLLIGMAYMTYFERKVMAAMQDRIGPNRTGFKGLLQPIADGIKLLGKEDLIPGSADKVIFYFAPLLIFITALVRVAVIPFGDTIELFGRDINLFVADLNVGALFLLAFGSIGVYGIILGAYASTNRYSLLGGLRAAAQVVSYETILALSLVGIFILSGSLSVRQIMLQQSGRPRVRPVDPAELVHPLAAAGLYHFPDRRRRRDEPGAVRLAGSRDGAGLGVPHRVLRFPLLLLLPRRVHQYDHRLAVRGGALSGWHRRPRRDRVLGLGSALAASEGDFLSLLLRLAPGPRSPASATTS